MSNVSKELLAEAVLAARNEKLPRLPHEHDESSDSQASGPREDMKQAYQDISSGQMDTDLHGLPGVEEVIKNKRQRDKTGAPIPSEPSKK